MRFALLVYLAPPTGLPPNTTTRVHHLPSLHRRRECLGHYVVLSSYRRRAGKLCNYFRAGLWRKHGNGHFQRPGSTVTSWSNTSIVAKFLMAQSPVRWLLPTRLDRQTQLFQCAAACDYCSDAGKRGAHGFDYCHGHQSWRKPGHGQY